MTHSKLVTKVAKWLRTTRKMPIVVEELVALTTGEIPDVIAWRGDGRSTIVEVKVSRSDFLADKKKWFRRYEGLGMGRERFFAAPRGMIQPSELPDRWGLIEVTERGCRMAVSPRSFADVNERSELALLVSALRRATEGWGRNVFGEIAPQEAREGDGDAHPKVARILRKQRAEIDRLTLELKNAKAALEVKLEWSVGDAIEGSAEAYAAAREEARETIGELLAPHGLLPATGFVLGDPPPPEGVRVVGRTVDGRRVLGGAPVVREGATTWVHADGTALVGASDDGDRFVGVPEPLLLRGGDDA